MIKDWEHRWEFLQLILEVYQFARDAHVAEAWLLSQEPYLRSDDFGDTLDEVELYIKKHEAFEKSFHAQEERFGALERLTTYELKEMRKRQEEEYRRMHPDADIPPAKESPPMKHRVIEDFLREEKEMEEKERLRREQIEIEEARRRDFPQEKIQVEKTPSHEAREEKRESGGEPFVNGDEETPSGARTTPPKRGEGEAGLGEEVENEGSLGRKHEWETHDKKASNRSWHHVYVVQQGVNLSFYKDKKHKLQEIYYHGEEPVKLSNAEVTIADDYTKKKHVFRLKLQNGGEFLFQAKDDDEMNSWVEGLKTVAEGSEEGASAAARAATFPTESVTSPGKKEKKKGGFFTLRKK